MTRRQTRYHRPRPRFHQLAVEGRLFSAAFVQRVDVGDVLRPPGRPLVLQERVTSEEGDLVMATTAHHTTFPRLVPGHAAQSRDHAYLYGFDAHLQHSTAINKILRTQVGHWNRKRLDRGESP